jgi:NAD(P)H-dependent FMN reductase
MKLQIIISSVRQNRTTPRLATWIANEARKLPDTEVEIVDLIDYPLPLFDEPVSPRYNPARQIGEAAGKWVTKLSGADAYVFVTPEYNHSIPGALKNALDFLTWELLKKPATVAAHGTVGGARAMMQLKEILSESRAAILPTQLAFLPRLGEAISEGGQLSAELRNQPYGPQVALQTMLTELKWYSDALGAARAHDQK